MQQQDQHVQQPLPKAYFDLILKVGSKGVYQQNIFIIFLLNWFVSGQTLLGTALLFFNRSFDCVSQDIQTQFCQQTICKMNPDQWEKYLSPQLLESVATEFGPYYCDNVFALGAVKALVYVGTSLGFIGLSIIMDNYGRKFALVISNVLTSSGLFIMAISPNIYTFGFGFFVLGVGCDVANRITATLINQVVDYYQRQKYLPLMQSSYAIGCVMIGISYWIFREWRIVIIIFMLIPALIMTLCGVLYVKETPKFLLRNKEKGLKELNWMGFVNKGEHGLVTEEDINSVLEGEVQQGEFGTMRMTPFSLIYYKSLRLITLSTTVVLVAYGFSYFGQIVVIDKIGFNPFLSQIILGFSQFSAYMVVVKVITKTPRRICGIIVSVAVCGVSVIMGFVHPNDQCNNCVRGIIEIVLAFISRFGVSFYFAIFLVYVPQVYPMRIRGIGFGFISGIGFISASTAQVLFPWLEGKNFSPMFFQAIIMGIGVMFLFFFQETLNKPLKEQIDEIQTQKDKLKDQSHQPSSN